MKLHITLILPILFTSLSCNLFDEDMAPVDVVLVDEEKGPGILYSIQWNTATESAYGDYRAIMKVGTETNPNRYKSAVIDFRISTDQTPEPSCTNYVQENYAFGFYSEAGTMFNFNFNISSIRTPPSSSPDSVVCFQFIITGGDHVLIRIEDR